jgi:hypothetical protein
MTKRIFLIKNRYFIFIETLLHVQMYLVCRTIRLGDMSELYKIIMGKYDEDVSNFLKNIETIYQQEKKL